MKKNQTIPELIWQFFCSVKLAVYTLVLLAVTSIIGTIILQDGTKPEYIRLYGEAFYNLIKVFSIDDMYHSWWFLAMVVVLCINIVVCSIERLSATWKIIFPKKVTFNPDRFRKQKNLETFTVQTEVQSLSDRYNRFLAKTVGNVIKQETENSIVLYTEKGRWTRIGIYVVHSSILLLLMGALIGSLFGFKANLQLDEGQTSDTAFIDKKRVPIKLEFSIRCNDFNVKFYDTGAPEEFKSNLTIIENGKESFTQDIRVNHPLRYKGINIFQSSYGTAQPDRVVFEIIRLSDKSVTRQTIKIGEEIQLPENQGLFKLEGFLPHFDFKDHNLGEAFIGKITQKDGNSFQIGLPMKFPTFDKMRKGTFAFVVKEFEQKHYTGLQITKDPGIWYVYSGFILMIIGCWVTFFMSHQSYFIEIESSQDNVSKVFISGTTNRNTQGLKLKIQKMVTKLKDK
ncbi:MAG: cytochrome c biogenesis protein ResB [Proteobacteria bacterium]|nr:cytochrome c biogenesis protein ResB [Pseudomonadota bacterium]MBU1584969.1 cytochrome c biogenesis protein ResB [Pseudomonadota bacterium]MBU2630544.1 cytochrome c biogenesis protein ResB [Pseudomonadota bacterium]